MSGNSERIGDKIILERMYAAEQVNLSQADALDMKASYLLVVLVFLAQLSTTFLSMPKLTYAGKASQWLSCVLLLGAGICLLLELRIKKYKAEDAADLEAWRDRVISDSKDDDAYKNSANPEEYLESRIEWGLIASSKPRIAKGEEVNGRKVKHLNLAYWLSAGAFFMDIVFMIIFSQFYANL